MKSNQGRNLRNQLWPEKCLRICRMTERKHRFRSRVLSGILAFAFLAVTAASAVFASDTTEWSDMDLFFGQEQIRLVQLSGKPELGSRTHKGFIRTHFAVLKKDGITDKEIYLPVVVSPEEEVYVPLEVMAAHLGLETQQLSAQEMYLETDGGTLYFRNLQPEISFIPSDVKFEQNVTLTGQLPVQWYDDRCCVGLDDLLGALGLHAEYRECEPEEQTSGITDEASDNRTDDADREVLLITGCVGNSRLGAFREFFGALEQEYRFIMGDLGANLEGKKKELLLSAILDYLRDFWDTDLVRFTLTSWIPLSAAQDFAGFFYDKHYLEIYLAYQVTWNEQMGEQLLGQLQSGAEGAAELLSVLEGTKLLTDSQYGIGTEVPVLKDIPAMKEGLAGKAASIGTHMLSTFEKMGFRTGTLKAWLEKNGETAGKIAGKGAETLGKVIIEILEAAAMFDQYESGDDYEVEAADAFLDSQLKAEAGVSPDRQSNEATGFSDSQSTRYTCLDPQMIRVLGSELEYYQEEAKQSFLPLIAHYAERSLGKWLGNLLGSYLGSGSKRMKASILFWDSAGKSLTKGAKSKMEAYMAGYYGISYELDAIQAAQEYWNSLMLSQGSEAGSDRSGTHFNEEEMKELELLAYNAGKACWCTRELILEGISGIGENESLRETRQQQEAINSKLAENCARLRSTNAYEGYLPTQLQEMMGIRMNHLPHVILSVVEISGQIIDAQTQAPAPHVAVGIYGEEDMSLGVDATDEAGNFLLSFDLDDGDLYEDRPDIRDLTIHVLTEQYAAIVVPVTVRAGKRYRLDGLQAGELTKENYIYLTGAKEQNGVVILEGKLIRMAPDAFRIQPSDEEGAGGGEWLSGGLFGSSGLGDFDWTGIADALGLSDTIYVAVGDQIKVQDGITQVMLPWQFSFSTVYGHAFDGIEWTGLLLDEVSGGEDARTLMKDRLQTADEINTYIEMYRKYCDDTWPAYRLLTSNSKVTGLEPVWIVSDQM